MMRILELNAGCGGMSAGFRRAGLPVTWAVDWNRDACASYLANFRYCFGHQILKRDIRELARGNWSTRFDMIVADTPCRGCVCALLWATRTTAAGFSRSRAWAATTWTSSDEGPRDHGSAVCDGPSGADARRQRHHDPAWRRRGAKAAIQPMAWMAPLGQNLSRT